MKTKHVAILTLLALVLLSSCTHRLVGVWSVENFETINQGNEGVAAKNIGTITFNKDKTGIKDLNFTIFGITKEDNAPFTWILQDHLLTINGDNSEIAKTWIVIEDDKKYQKMKSTDGADQVQILELRKK